MPQQSKTQGNSTEGPYSEFSKTQKRWIIGLVAFAGMFSPLSSFIYYPALHTLASDLTVTVTMINLTITSYMVVSGVAPAIVGDLADTVGRRPVYIVAFLIYFAANIGLALQKSYPALLALRMLQSAAGSGTISLAYGVVSDIATPAERGSFVGAVLCGPNIAPIVGPILGGVLAGRRGWPWIFWFLAILSGVCLLTLFVFFPETARTIVGSGGYPATIPGLNICSTSGRQKHFPEQKTNDAVFKRLYFPNPLKCLRLLLQRNNILVAMINGIFYATYCCVQASLALLFIEIYHFEEVQAGLIYLPFGCGCALASLISGASITCLFNMCGTLLTDLNPQNPALAQAASNIIRCTLSATGLAVLQLMIEQVGPGWTFTIFAGLCLLTAPMILAVVKWGFGWRAQGIQDLEFQANAQT
ncbi:MAG: hypothetical protein L6R39_005527 [Caloplaca ligustica]|nr:MAG: hypothetical protein L6R39_005527 [Caloplaca ligustica]